MATLNGLPVFKIRISEDLSDKTGIDFISLVDFPAIESNWVAMAEKKPLKFSFSTDQKLLYGPALIPDFPIYRYDEKQGEYYVVFTKDEIQKITRKFQKQNKNLNLNYQHKPNSQVDAVIQETWLTGKTDKSQEFGFSLPEGSLFVVTYVEDDKFWNEQVKTGNVKGYSIEGWLDMELRKIKYKMEAKTKEGLTLKTADEVLAVNSVVMTVAEDGTESATLSGEYELENGDKVTVVDGKVTAITPAQMDEVMTEEEISALSKVFEKVLAPLNEKINALEAKLASMPGTPSITEGEKETPTPSAKETALAKVEKVRSVYSKIKNK